MLYREIVAVCSEIYIKHVNTMCGKNVQILDIKLGGGFSSQWTLKG
jgi:hypothetical protein